MSTKTKYAILAGVLGVTAASPAYAYLDPGTGSIMLQAVIGAVAGGMFVMRSYYHKAVGWFSERQEKAVQDK